MPSYNHGHFLKRALDSLIVQTYNNWQLIIVDNHSTDNTNEVVSSFNDPRITYLKTNNNGVIAASRNIGIEASKGQWIAFLDSDDYWTKDKLEVCSNYFEDDIDLVHHDLKIVPKKLKFLFKKLFSRQAKTPALIDLLLNGNFIANSSVVVRKKLLLQIGGISENKEMIAAEDYNAWLRISELTEGFHYIQETLGFYEMHINAVSAVKDMSVPTRIALSEFEGAINESLKIKIEANLRFIKGKFNYHNKNYLTARKEFLFCAKNGLIKVKIKSILLLLAIEMKNHF